MKKYILSYTFLNVDCILEFTNLFDFSAKLEWCQQQAEILQHTIDFKTE
jgi:hypothetical protein